MSKERFCFYTVFLLLVTAFVSISLFEVVVGLSLLCLVVSLVRREVRVEGRLLPGLTLFSIPTVISTSIYGSAGKAIEQGIFPFLYLLKGKINFDLEDFKKVNIALILIGYILMPVALYKYYFLGEYGMFWGGPFEIGMWFSLFSLASLALLLYSFSEERSIYWKVFFFVSFVLFVLLILLSAKRNSILGFLVSLMVMFVVYRRIIPRKVILSVISVVLVAGIGFSFYFVNKDVRFQTLYRITTGEVQISDESVNQVASGRWQLFKEGLEVIKKDIQEGNLFNILFGHGVGCGQRLNPKSFNGSDYESTIFISEFIVRGFVGLVGIVLIMFSYYRFLFSLKVESAEYILLAPSLLMLSCIFVGSIFSGFWDALFPLYFLLFGIAERYLRQRDLSV